MSKYHFREMVFDPFARFMISYQHYLFYTIMGLARFNLYAQSWILLVSNEKVAYKNMEKLTLVLFACWYIGLVSTLPAHHIFPYVLISHFVSGILHLQICLSHFAMETFNGTPYTPGNKRDEWFQLQIRTTQDIDCPTWMDWFHGGL